MHTVRSRWLWAVAILALRSGYRGLYYRLAVAAVDTENAWRVRRGLRPFFVSAESRARGRIAG